MRAPQWVSDFFDWRWAPCVGLTAGSLAFVALALLFIPAQFEGTKQVGETASSLDHSGSAAPRAWFGASLAQGISGGGQRTPEAAGFARAARPSPPATSEDAVRLQQRGFSPVLDRPEPPPPPVAEAPPPLPPEPAVTAVQQPEPEGAQREVRVP